MTRGEEFERLQFRATREKNNSLVESLFHPDRTYESNAVPTALKSRGEENIMWETEDKDHVHVHKYHELKNAEAFYSVTQKVTYNDRKVFHQQEEYEELDYDPSVGQSWTWEDVRWYWEMIIATEVTFKERQAFADQKGIPTLTNSSTGQDWNWEDYE